MTSLVWCFIFLTKYFKPLEVFFHKFFAHLTRNQEDKPKTQVNSKFWDKIIGEEGWKYSYIWGLLYGFGKKNSLSHFWKNRHFRVTDCSDKEKFFSAEIKKWSSCKNRPFFTDKNAFTISNFTIPIFNSFTKDDPIVTKYEAEREKIKQLYKGKDFVTYTLELLTDTSGIEKKQKGSLSLNP